MSRVIHRRREQPPERLFPWWARWVPLSPDPSVAALTSAELIRGERRGELVRLRRGTYLPAADEPRDSVERHRQLVRATLPLVAGDAVVSHLSAAVLHGLPVWNQRLAQVQVTRRPPGSGRRRGYLHTHAAPLTGTEVVTVGGLPVTSLARTVLDLARTLPLEQAVAAGDAALRAGLDLAELAAVVEEARGRPGLAAARRAVAMLDGRSESAGESHSRVVLVRLGLAPSDLQFEVYDHRGRLVARSDFAWAQQRTLGEFDGRIKYEGLLEPGQRASEVVYAEKLREDAAREEEWEMVRWSWADLQREQLLAERIRRAQARGARFVRR